MEDVRFEVLDADANLVDVIHPTSTGTVTWDPSSRITRTLQGVKLDPNETAPTPYVHRIRPVWVDDTETPLGVFLYPGGTGKELAGGTWTEVAPMPDRCVQLDQKLRQSFGFTSSKLTDALEALAASAGITDTDFFPSGQLGGDPPLLWLAGESTRLQIADQLTDWLGFLPCYFDQNGTLIARPVPVPVDAAPDHVYTAGQVSRVIADSAAETVVANRPNVYLVRSTSPTGTPITGIYDVPDSFENSVANIGFEIVSVIDLDGLTSPAQAVATAQARAQRDAQVVRTITFDTEPDPSHDAYDIVEWEGTRMLEQSWSLELVAGGKHTHTVTSTYA